MKKISVKNLYIIVFLYSLFANFAHPVTPTFIQNLGLHDYMFGLAFACMSLANFVFSPFWGKISAKYGAANVLSFAFVGYGVMQFCFGVSSQEWQICLARFIGGFFISALSVAQLVYIMDNSAKQGKDLAKITALNSIVSQFGFLVGGFLGDIGIRLTFNIQAIGLALCGILTFFILKDSPRSEVAFSLKDINPFKDFIDCKDIITKYIFLFLVIVLLSQFGATCYEQCFNYYIKDQFNFPASYNGIVKAIIGFIQLGVNTFITMKLISYTDTNTTITYVFASLVTMLLGVIFISNFTAFMLVNILFFGFNSIVATVLNDMIPKHKNAKPAEFAGLFNSIKMLGSTIGSLTAGFVYDCGAKMSFVLAAIALSACIFISLIHKKASVSIE